MINLSRGVLRIGVVIWGLGAVLLVGTLFVISNDRGIHFAKTFDDACDGWNAIHFEECWTKQLKEAARAPDSKAAMSALMKRAMEEGNKDLLFDPGVSLRVWQTSAFRSFFSVVFWCHAIWGMVAAVGFGALAWILSGFSSSS